MCRGLGLGDFILALGLRLRFHWFSPRVLLFQGCNNIGVMRISHDDPSYSPYIHVR